MLCSTITIIVIIINLHQHHHHHHVDQDVNINVRLATTDRSSTACGDSSLAPPAPPTATLQNLLNFFTLFLYTLAQNCWNNIAKFIELFPYWFYAHLFTKSFFNVFLSFPFCLMFGLPNNSVKHQFSMAPPSWAPPRSSRLDGHQHKN